MFKLSDSIRVFQVIFPQKGIEENAMKLQSIGVNTFDMREADVQNKEDKTIIDKIYILRCSSLDSAINLVMDAFTSEMMYEGYRTFY